MTTSDSPIGYAFYVGFALGEADRRAESRERTTGELFDAASVKIGHYPLSRIGEDLALIEGYTDGRNNDQWRLKLDPVAERARFAERYLAAPPVSPIVNQEAI